MIIGDLSHTPPTDYVRRILLRRMSEAIRDIRRLRAKYSLPWYYGRPCFPVALGTRVRVYPGRVEYQPAGYAPYFTCDVGISFDALRNT